MRWKPLDAVPQRRLVYQLTLAIDTAMLAEELGQGDVGVREVDALLDANPRSAFSTHVIHNIGARRARWLRSRAATRARVASSM